MDTIVNGFSEGLDQMSWLEGVAVTFGLLSVWFAKKENIWVFPTGMVSVLIYVHICFGFKLYADMGINAYYFVMSVYGWIAWSRKISPSEFIPITKSSKQENLMSLAIMILSFGLLYFTLQTFTDSDVPFWDSLTTAVAFTAMWLMARKKLENWVAWIITDLISIPLYFYKGLILTSFQFLIFLLLATAGYLAWKKALKK